MVGPMVGPMVELVASTPRLQSRDKKLPSLQERRGKEAARGMTVMIVAVRAARAHLTDQGEVTAAMASTTSITTNTTISTTMISTTSMTNITDTARTPIQMTNARVVRLTKRRPRLPLRVNMVQRLVRRRPRSQCTARGASTMDTALILIRMMNVRVARRVEPHTRRLLRLVLSMENAELLQQRRPPPSLVVHSKLYLLYAGVWICRICHAVP